MASKYASGRPPVSLPELHPSISGNVSTSFHSSTLTCRKQLYLVLLPIEEIGEARTSLLLYGEGMGSTGWKPPSTTTTQCRHLADKPVDINGTQIRI